MRLIPAIIVSSICLLAVADAQTKAARPKEIVATPAAQVAAQPAAAPRSSASAEEQQALRDDLRKMRALVQQMETNLAFVDNTPSPLKHQFQLEIEMWRTLIDHMERRLQPSGR